MACPYGARTQVFQQGTAPRETRNLPCGEDGGLAFSERTCEAFSFVSCAVKSELGPAGLTQVFSSSNQQMLAAKSIDAHRRNKPSAIHNNKPQEHIPKRLAIINRLSEMSRVFCTI